MEGEGVEEEKTGGSLVLASWPASLPLVSLRPVRDPSQWKGGWCPKDNPPEVVLWLPRVYVHMYPSPTEIAMWLIALTLILSPRDFKDSIFLGHLWFPPSPHSQ